MQTLHSNISNMRRYPSKAPKNARVPHVCEVFNTASSTGAIIITEISGPRVETGSSLPSLPIVG